MVAPRCFGAVPPVPPFLFYMEPRVAPGGAGGGGGDARGGGKDLRTEVPRGIVGCHTFEDVVYEWRYVRCHLFGVYAQPRESYPFLFLCWLGPHARDFHCHFKSVASHSSLSAHVM
jgi:hypothetical protein